MDLVEKVWTDVRTLKEQLIAESGGALFCYHGVLQLTRGVVRALMSVLLAIPIC